jgi:hypothetical protein
MTEDPRTPTPETTLAWEARNRTRAGVSALAAAVLTIAGTIFSIVGLNQHAKHDDKIVTVTDALRLSAQGRPIPEGRVAAQTLYVGHHPTLPILGAILFAIGALLIFPPLAYLFRATRARRPGYPQLALVLAAVGVVTYGVGRGVSQIAYTTGAMNFVDSADKSNSAATDAVLTAPFSVGQILSQVGGLAVAFALVLLGLNAMRVGLLTRFMGILGAIVGATFILPLDQYGIIRSFWLAALGALILGRWPSGVPKAWQTGEAEPWPSQQQLREQREAAKAGAAGTNPERAERPRRPKRGASDPPAPPRPEPAATAPHPASKKKKRKRRS